jgi:DNA-binding NarL/FixJ family response regulator
MQAILGDKIGEGYSAFIWLLAQADSGEKERYVGFDEYISGVNAPLMSSMERARAQILVVESDGMARNSLKQTLATLGYMAIYDAPNHAMALQKLAERPISHIIFEAKKTNMPAADFLTAVLSCDEKIVALPSSHEPSVDDVFGLLMLGARGYICKPYTPDAVDDAISMATKGEPLSEAILFAKDRNEALVSLVMTALDKLAVTMKQSRQFETAERELTQRVLQYRRATEIAKTFAQGGKPKLLESLIEFCLERGEGPASRLGRIRKRLGERKGKIVKIAEAAAVEEALSTPESPSESDKTLNTESETVQSEPISTRETGTS